MAKNVFSVPIFLIVLRETIEAGIIVSILLSFVLQLTRSRTESTEATAVSEVSDEKEKVDEKGQAIERGSSTTLTNKQLLRKLRVQVWLGTIAGFFIALCIGGAFIGVFYSSVGRDLWSKSEEIWEGTFSLIASFIILAMGIAFLRLEQSKAKWRVHLAHAFEKRTAHTEKEGIQAKYALFLLPLITVLREGVEAVVFVGGVSLGQTANSIPLAVVVGLLCGIVISYLIYRGGSVLAIHWFLVVSTCVLFLVGAGLFSKACGFYQIYVFNRGVGADVEELGDGPGSFNVAGNVWHLTYGNPEGRSNNGGGWSIFNAILGWTNTATIGTILCYVFYWIFIIGVLYYLKWSEGRTTLLGLTSRRYKERMNKRLPTHTSDVHQKESSEADNEKVDERNEVA